MNVFLIVLLVAIGLLFVYEAFMLVRSIIRKKKEGTKKQPPRINNNVQRKE